MIGADPSDRAAAAGTPRRRLSGSARPGPGSAAGRIIVHPGERHGVDAPAVTPLALRLLGPIEMFDDGRVLAVGPPQRQVVLAALAVDADTPVPVELLVDRVWGGRPPDAARAALHAHIARLRRVLAQSRTTLARLSRHSGGYVLEIDRDQVDLHRFRRLLSQAREPGCDDGRRVRLVRAALSIWRGPPLASLPGGWASRLRYSIEPQLISAAVIWAQAELRLGRIHEAIDKLGQLTSLHPLSEPLVAVLMRALCGAGRRSEALQRYAAIRALLREELGTEPGADLRHLHTAILRGELDPQGPVVSGGAGQESAARHPLTRRPRQLPTAVPGFTGRVRELAAVEAAFTAAAQEGSAALVAINGYGGVGKSALAHHAAHRLLEAFPDGQLYIDLRGHGLPQPRSTAEVLDRFLRALGVPAAVSPTDVEEAAELFRSVTAGQRLLAVLDNVRDLAQIRLLLPGVPGSGVLVTSRRALVGLEGATHLYLDTLAEPEAVELLRRLVGVARVNAEPTAAAQVAGWCGFLPLALRAAAARLAARPRWPIAALAERLADEQGRMAELDLTELSVSRSFAASYQELATSTDPADQVAAAAFTRLGRWGRSQFIGADVARLLGQPIPDADRVLERLVDARLLGSPAPGSYLMPHLLRLYAGGVRRPQEDLRPG